VVLRASPRYDAAVMDRAAAYRDLEALYAELDAELARLRPLCRLSGRCCRFRDFRHQLWVTRLELDFLLEREGLPASTAEGTCPFLKGGLCGARAHRMLGCRVFFCDEAYKPRMGPLYEEFHRRLKDLHRRHGVPYEYSELLAELDRRRAGEAATLAQSFR
jgi:hypothetical protein